MRQTRSVIGTIKQQNSAITGRTPRCRCRFRHALELTAASRGFHCDKHMYAVCMWVQYKKLSYRRETARQLHTSFSAHSLIVHFTEHLICFTTMYNRLAKLVPTISANKPCDIRTLSWIGHSRSFNVILIGADRNPEWSVVVMCN